MSLERLVYSPLKEDCTPDYTGWDKDTIAYVTANRSRVHRVIRGEAKKLSKPFLQISDVEDIYSEVLMYCYKYDDYNITKAIERSTTGKIISLEGYINNCIKHCTMRYLTKEYAIDKEQIGEYSKMDNGDELSIFDKIGDKSDDDNNIDNLVYNLEELCSLCESIRGKYGVDIYLIWYVRLLTMLKDKPEKAFKEILEVLDISKRDIKNIEDNIVDENLMSTFAKSISLVGIEESIEIIGKYVYAKDVIKAVIDGYN